jgi:hypothetical protein
MDLDSYQLANLKFVFFSQTFLTLMQDLVNSLLEYGRFTVSNLVQFEASSTAASNTANRFLLTLETGLDVTRVLGFADIPLFYKTQLPTLVQSFSKSTSFQFKTQAFSSESLDRYLTQSFEESTAVARNKRYQNPVFKPDFKSGNFFTRDDLSRRPFLLTTLADLSKGMRRPAWFFTSSYADSLQNLKASYLQIVENAASSTVASTFIHNPYSFFNVFHLLISARRLDMLADKKTVLENPFMNQRWLSLNAFDQKFHRMYNSMSLQQRVVSN